MLKLKQQQLQFKVLKARQEHRTVQQAAEAAERKISAYRLVFNDTAGVNVHSIAEPEDVRTSIENIAGVSVPVFESVTFPEAAYSVFGTPPWVDQTLADLRERNRYLAELEIVERKLNLLEAALKKVMQRVNLFEKIIIPEARENIRSIRIALGDQMGAAVARAKIAKAKFEERERDQAPEAVPL